MIPDPIKPKSLNRQDIFLPNGKTLYYVMQCFYSWPNALKKPLQPKITAAVKAGMPQEAAEFFALTGISLLDDVGGLVLDELPEGKEEELNAIDDDFEYLARAIPYRVNIDHARPWRYAILNHIRDNKQTQREFYSYLLKNKAAGAAKSDTELEERNGMLDRLLRNGAKA